MATIMGYNERNDELTLAVRQFLADGEDRPAFVKTAKDLREWVAELYDLEDEIDDDIDPDE